LAVANISSGFFFNIYYAGDLINSSTLSLEKRIDSILIHFSFAVLGSVLSFFIVHRFNHKDLMFTGLVLMGLVQIATGMSGMLAVDDDTVIDLITLNLFIYEATAAPLYWVYAPELVKFEDFSRIQMGYWALAGLNALISYETPSEDCPLITLLFGIVCLVLAGTVGYFMIETRNKKWREKYSIVEASTLANN
jgi:uncharacterized membrane protein